MAIRFGNTSASSSSLVAPSWSRQPGRAGLVGDSVVRQIQPEVLSHEGGSRRRWREPRLPEHGGRKSSAIETSRMIVTPARTAVSMP